MKTKPTKVPGPRIERTVMRQFGDPVTTCHSKVTPRLAYLLIEGECYLLSKNDAYALGQDLIAISQEMDGTP